MNWRGGGGLYFTSKRVATFKGRKIERARRKIRTWRITAEKNLATGELYKVWWERGGCLLLLCSSQRPAVNL
jgi:hypothetical protein